MPWHRDVGDGLSLIVEMGKVEAPRDKVGFSGGEESVGSEAGRWRESLSCRRADSRDGQCGFSAGEMEMLNFAGQPGEQYDFD